MSWIKDAENRGGKVKEEADQKLKAARQENDARLAAKRTEEERLSQMHLEKTSVRYLTKLLMNLPGMQELLAELVNAGYKVTYDSVLYMPYSISEYSSYRSRDGKELNWASTNNYKSQSWLAGEESGFDESLEVLERRIRLGNLSVSLIPMYVYATGEHKIFIGDPERHEVEGNLFDLDNIAAAVQNEFIRQIERAG
jgi:hypothetical protein